MVRAAMKNHASVAVVVDPLGYDGVLAAVRAGGFTLEERKKAGRAGLPPHRRIRRGRGQLDGRRPGAGGRRVPAAPWFGRTWRRTSCCVLRREPLHQRAALYSDDVGWPGLAQAQQLHGKEMSHNNFTDADAAWRAAFDHEQICVAIIKHANPCGIAIRRCRWPTRTARPTSAIRCPRSVA